MIYIAFEGVDNTGKTTLINKIKPLLNKIIKEYDLGKITYIVEKELDFEADVIKDLPRKEVEIMKAIRYHQQRTQLHKDIDLDIEISDRSILSTLAYQGEYVPFHVLEDVLSPDFDYPDFVVFMSESGMGIADPRLNIQHRYRNILNEYKIPYVEFNKDDDDVETKILTEILSFIIKRKAKSLSETLIKTHDMPVFRIDLGEVNTDNQKEFIKELKKMINNCDFFGKDFYEF